MTCWPGCGINLTHWLPERAWLRRLFHRPVRRDDLARITDWGFEHVRLPILESQAFDAKHRRRSRTFDTLERVLDWCAELGLIAVVDLHRLRSHDQESSKPDDLFHRPDAVAEVVAMWDDLSSVLSRRPVDQVAYDLISEGRAPSPQAWHAVQQAVIAAMRRREPDRVVCYGPYWYRALGVVDTHIVIDDPALLLSFHHYRPNLLTHYRLKWSKSSGGYDGPVHYPGVPIADADLGRVHPVVPHYTPSYRAPCSAAMFAAWLAIARSKAASANQSLYCAEFGCSRLAPTELRLRWLRDLLTLFTENNVAWALWEYRGDFGLLTPAGDPTDALPLAIEFCRRSRLHRGAPLQHV